MWIFCSKKATFTFWSIHRFWFHCFISIISYVLCNVWHVVWFKCKFKESEKKNNNTWNRIITHHIHTWLLIAAYSKWASYSFVAFVVIVILFYFYFIILSLGESRWPVASQANHDAISFVTCVSVYACIWFAMSACLVIRRVCFFPSFSLILLQIMYLAY